MKVLMNLKNLEMISSENLIKNRIMIVGSNGMLGQRFVEFYLEKENVELLAASAEEDSFIKNVSYSQIDIADKTSVKKVIYEFYPDFIINTAAYTNVDRCEFEKETAWKVNALGPEYLAFFSMAVGAHLIHISTDYIFDGSAGPYSETDKPNPINYYGRSKLAGENAVRSSRNDFTIIRTNVLYGPAKFGRPDFVKWVVENLREKKEIKIVIDQINNPAYIDDLVGAMVKIVKYRKRGIFNIGGPEFLSRYDFTLRIADYFELDKSLIKKIVTEDLKQPAPRPLKSGLITLIAETELSYKPRLIEETFFLMKKELEL